MESINWLSVIIATLIPSVLGFIYYHKALFGNAWMDSIGMTEEKAREANMAVTMGLSIVMSFLMVMFMTNWVNSPCQEGEFDNFMHGVGHGAFISLFIIIPIFISNGLFEQRSWKNILINSLYWLITLSAIGGIVDAMNHM